ncbi:MAG: hypothetical protein H8D95_01070 [Candidatus Endolissoclinum sp.]|nr:hypothetical protein [Candidatus Endolissoclinum sp.]
MSFSANDFDKWMQKQGPPIKDPSESTLLPSQIKMLKEYPECKTANDLPFDIQQDIIELNEYDNATTTDGNLQSEVDAFLEYQYSLLSRNFRDFINAHKDPIK